MYPLSPFMVETLRGVSLRTLFSSLYSEWSASVYGNAHVQPFLEKNPATSFIAEELLAQ